MQGCPEKAVAHPGFESLKGCICRGVLVPVSELFLGEGGFIGESWYEGVEDS